MFFRFMECFSWDVNTTLDDLPLYIQMCYKSLIETYIEIEDEMVKTGESYLVHYAIKDVCACVYVTKINMQWYKYCF